jgi:hypothetical protein
LGIYETVIKRIREIEHARIVGMHAPEKITGVGIVFRFDLPQQLVFSGIVLSNYSRN